MNSICEGKLNHINTWKNHNKVRQLCKNFVMSNTKLKEIMNQMSYCINEGLSKKTHSEATIKCWQTYVQDMPTGNEEGHFLALDLGGTNFRILKLELGKNKNYKMDQNVFSCSKELMAGTGTQLFDYIANCLDEFVTLHGIKSEKVLPLGFTFSFPISQLSIDSGKLVRWTKGFTCDGVVGQDIVELLNKAIHNIQGLNIKTCAILNDTVGTLMSCAWENPKTRIGLIIGTGCNCCYVEKTQKIELYSKDAKKTEMIINLEWGAFGDNKELQKFRTSYDRQIDYDSENKGQQTFEKMVSGMYMGELLRLLLIDLIEAGLIFKGQMPTTLNNTKKITTEMITIIESDPPGTNNGIKQLLRTIEVENPTDGDCMNIRYAAECISRRSAHLVAAGLAVILNKINEKDVIIGVDGSVYKYHPFYHKLLVNKLNELTKPDIKFDILLSEDGSGKGAAVLASSVYNNN